MAAGTWEWEGAALLHYSVNSVRRVTLRRVAMAGTVSGWALYTADGMAVRESSGILPLRWSAKQTAQRMTEQWVAKLDASVPVCP